MKKIIYILTIFVCSACFQNSSELQATFATSSQRAEMLSQSVNQYNRAFYWNDEAKLSRLVTAEMRPQISERLKARRKKENLVDVEVQSVELDDEHLKAEVEMKTRFYKVPLNVVKERIEKQTWSFFRFEGGWKLSEISLVDDDLATVL